MAAKGQPKTGGRAKGTPNKVTRTLRDDIIEVHEKLGGTQGMLNWAKESDVNKRIFYSQILPKVLPKEIQAKVAHELPPELQDEDVLKRMASAYMMGLETE